MEVVLSDVDEDVDAGSVGESSYRNFWMRWPLRAGARERKSRIAGPGRIGESKRGS